jgi:hypothetical protein
MIERRGHGEEELHKKTENENYLVSDCGVEIGI